MLEYAEAREVSSPDGLYFYHTIELPDFGLMEGDWDLRHDARAYLGNVDFRGRSCLDMGAATGYMSFKMEELGASRVVSYDIRKGSDWDIVPHYRIARKLAQVRREADASIERMKDAYWFCHRALNSRAQAFYGSIYDVPEALGRFDVVFFGMVLTHLRDPYWALYEGGRLCSDTLVITGIWDDTDQPVSTFRPSGAKTGELDVKSWWLLSRGTIASMIGTLGFEVENVVPSNVILNAGPTKGPRTCQAIVARRVAD